MKKNEEVKDTKKEVKKVSKKEDTKKIEKKEETKPVKKITKKRIKKESDTVVVDKTISFSLTEVIVIIILTGLVVSIASGLIVYNNYDRLNPKDEENTNYADIKEFVTNYNKIVNNYVGDVDKKQLIDYAIRGMYAGLEDSYSVYMDQDETRTIDDQLKGEYTGVGIEIRTEYQEDGTYITSINRIFKNSPAEEAGLKANDVLVKLDGVDVIDANHIANTIKYGDKESYDITYRRDGKEKTVTLTRKKIFIDSVSSAVLDGIGYIKIDTFSQTTASQVEKAIKEFDNDVKSVVIDVRDNTGGLLDSAKDVSDLFIEKGKVIYKLKDKNEKITERKADNEPIRKFDKIAVIVNENSASASEILALALKESAGAKVVGTKTFGKGTVQETFALESGAMVKYTSAYWLSPNGNSINEKGIEPDIVVEDASKQTDEALKAVK